MCLDLGAAVSRGMAALRAASRLDSGLGHTGSGVGTGLLHAQGETGHPDLWSGSRGSHRAGGMRVPSGHVAAELLHRGGLPSTRATSHFFPHCDEPRSSLGVNFTVGVRNRTLEIRAQCDQGAWA